MAGFLYFLAGVWVYFNQTGMIYLPDNRPLTECVLPEGATLWQEQDEQGVFSSTGNTRLLVFFHGNADSACSWRYLGVNHLEQLGYDVLVPEYPGYGGDTRTPSKSSIEGMLAVAGNWASTQNYTETVVMGYSLGTGAASLYAGQFQVDQVVLVAAYDSVFDVAWAQGLKFPRLLLQSDFDNVAALGGVKARIDIRYSGSDRVIPPAHSENLLRELRNNGQEAHGWIVPDASHQNLFDSPSFDQFLNEILLPNRR